jgi:hypothetical protein
MCARNTGLLRRVPQGTVDRMVIDSSLGFAICLAFIVCFIFWRMVVMANFCGSCFFAIEFKISNTIEGSWGAQLKSTERISMSVSG